MLEHDMALVTGASRGIGQAIALRLAGAGAFVVGTATSETGAARISARFEEAGLRGRGAVWNAGDPASTDALVAALAAAEGLLKSEDWEQTLNVNLSAVFRLTKACLRRMLKDHHGRIVNIGSVVGSIGNAGQVHYSAAKAGLLGFTRALARELASRNITVNAVAPGFIETDMTRALPEAQRAAYLAQIPAGRFGTPEEIAASVLFLASREAGYVTGQTLHVNGGMYMG
jgi:3-oxoacyl-[acyl-carrier protein] reductase